MSEGKSMQIQMIPKGSPGKAEKRDQVGTGYSVATKQEAQE